MNDPERFEMEKYVKYGEVRGSIDVLDKDKNAPLEFKTLRSANIDQPKIFQSKQLEYYMAMLICVLFRIYL